ncbi:MAG: HWE histidine kinase domain-containing protein [Croceibacterium sp.]
MDGILDRYPAIRRALLAEPPALIALGWSLLAVTVAVGMRLVTDGGSLGVPFMTFYPMVMLCSLLLGWRWGAFVTLLSGVVANRLVLERQLRFWDDTGDAVLVVMFFFSCSVLVATGHLARRALQRAQAAQEREELLNRELMHRVKNMLATVSALASMTARHSPPDQFQRAFSGRMMALQRATELLGMTERMISELAQLVDGAIEPFRADANFTVGGPRCTIPREACVPLSLALHELCTNASKYGALSVPQGRVSLGWAMGDGVLRLLWQEVGGPEVKPPSREGMGTQLLKRQRELGAVNIEYAPAGLRCTFDIPGAVEVRQPEPPSALPF